VPVGLVTFIGEEWQWHRGAAGTPIKKVEREHAICTHAIETEGPMVVEDLESDRRFEDNPYVGSFGSDDESEAEEEVSRSAEFRLYAGAPLVTPRGYRIGTVCVLDTVPRNISRRRVRCLEHLSDLAMEAIDGQL
jgi:GAF domain-containing protein